MSAVKLPIQGLVTHRRRVQRLYKDVLRTIESYHSMRDKMRIELVMMRDRFDKNKDIKNMLTARELVSQGEEELFKRSHWIPKKFAQSPGGCDYEREVIPPDWVVDYWHPLEKAQYPEYFARRELRKLEFIKNWKETYGKYDTPESSH